MKSQVLVQNINSYSSPEASSLNNQAGKYSVNHYTGRLNYSAAIQTVELSATKLDIGLQYSTAGFKVQDVASSVGLGWNTTFVGVITRVVEGLPDEDKNGYCGSNQIGGKAYQPLNQ